MKALALAGFLLISTFAFSQYKLYEDGLQKYKDGQYDRSISILTDFLNRRLRDKKFDIDAFYYRALSYYKTNNPQKAIDDFDEAILLGHPNSGNIYWFKAKCKIQLGDKESAIRDYTKALGILNGDKSARTKLLTERSQLYKEKGDLVAANADLQSINTPGTSNVVAKNTDKNDKQEASVRGTKDQPRQSRAEVKEPPREENKKPVVAEKKTVVEQPVTNTVVPAASTTTETSPSLAELYKDERRYALVIGNSNYPKNIGALKNPVNDATDMARELEKSNFKVQLLTNATYGQMRAALLEFKENVDAGDRDKTVSLFYYAGHGLQQDQENFLVPIDASIEFEDDIPRYCFPVQRMVLANMERSNSRINIVILDACRNNPFPSLNRSLGDQGLGEMKRARGSFIAYATAPGSVASDGTGKNGLYTQELVKAMQKPGLTIEQVFKVVRQNVLRFSGDKQNTWDSSNIIGEFYFKF